MALPVSTLFERLLEEKPTYLQVHPSTLRELLRLSRESGRKPDGLLGVKTESETVEPDLRAFCIEEWGVRITDIYSCQEACIIAIECPQVPHYHVQSEFCLVEILDDDGRPCEPGQLGRVVLTTLHNFATPLIRYELGDYAVPGEPCPCGRGLPVLASIAGRQRHLAVLPSGDRVTLALNFERVLNDLPIRQFQLIQRSLDEIEARLVVKRPMTEDEEQQLAAYFNRGFGHEFPFTFVYVDDIPRLASGKHEIFRSEVET
jgi:phenylacetate-CoA ligase